MNDVCELYQMIPKSELDRVFEGTAAAELGAGFMAFEHVYKAASLIVPKGWTILDLGCGYAPQAYYFTDHALYIGVDYPNIKNTIRFKTKNMKLFIMTIQQFVEEYLEKFDLRFTFAICSAVPDEDAQKTVAEYFPNRLIWYPGGKTDLRLEVKG